MDKIIFDRIQLYAFHGVLEEEQKLGQLFEVDLEMYLDLHEAGLTDNIDKTVNYATVYDKVKEIVIGTKKRLLEAVAECIADEILSNFPLKEIKVRVRKVNPPIPGHMGSVAVEIRRGRS